MKLQRWMPCLLVMVCFAVSGCDGGADKGKSISSDKPEIVGVISQEQAVKMARAAVDAPGSGVTVLAECEVEVTYADDKYTVTFLVPEPPPSEELTEDGDYYAIVIIDEKTGAVDLLGPP